MCSRHVEREAVAMCVSCGFAVCAECLTMIKHKAYCAKCIEAFFNEEASTSGQGSNVVIPPGVIGWSWGGFFLTWIWGVCNGVYIAFLAFIPYVGPIIMPFVLGAKGKEWAWRNKRWDSVESFRRSQRSWAIGGLIWILVVALFLFWWVPEFLLYGTSW